VLTLPGIPSGIRYTATSPNTSSPDLITYEFPDLSYTTSPSFQAVMNQSLFQSLINRIYAHASFGIRFYSELPTPSPPLHANHAPSHPDSNITLASIALSPVEGKEAEFLLWFVKDLLEGLSRVRGFVRARRFEFVSGVVRERNVVSVPDRPKYLLLVKFESGVEKVKGEMESWVAKGARRAQR
jgi:hypothetical protein